LELGHIEKGMHLFIVEEQSERATGEVYEAEYRYLESDALFLVRCNRLYERFNELGRNARLLISFVKGPFINSFTGCLKEKQRGGFILVEQLSNIISRNRRQFDRDEIRVPVRLYELPESMRDENYYKKPVNEPVLFDTIFDVSIGGICIITNKSLRSESDPFYLLEFSLTEKDYHILPAKLVRRSLYSRTSIGKFDYGFQFILDNMPDEAARLAKGIIYRKIART